MKVTRPDIPGLWEGPRADADYWMQAREEILKVDADPILQKPSGSSTHRLYEAFRTGKLISPFHDLDGDTYARLLPDLIPSAEKFVLQHDWARAFKGAENFEAGEVRWPYNILCWDFRLSGMNIAVVQHEPEYHPLQEPGPSVLLPFFETTFGWALGPMWFRSPGDDRVQTTPQIDEEIALLDIGDLVVEQTRAAMIVLEAKVAVTELIRAPSALNKRREKQGKTPLADYHVLVLNPRRVDRHSATVSTDRRRPRMHFRRGHWRHYEDHQTYIEWTLVGDPDLGFVDKEYRL